MKQKINRKTKNPLSGEYDFMHTSEFTLNEAVSLIYRTAVLKTDL